ncbi:lysophospholipid transporter LplT [Acetonema longum]|uniref:Lysophospholipid transporter LplT n=1 Tax=Acetonema longum DSM 6540 TaxID=1009370 RepID=F7NFI2_9FIRM|nr:lysophospholipid transporter LplT [Acetonema longum]EGO65181.1 lysophospholipid transporter LplT [Acetonema longum DSM 6540]
MHIKSLLQNSSLASNPETVQKGSDARRDEEAREGCTFGGYGERAPAGETTQTGLFQRSPGLSPLGALYLAQFLSAFVDNMILFIAQAIILRNNYPGYYLPLVQSMFLFSFIILSPWVGRFADRHAKARVLIVGNLIKAAGILLLMLGFDPAASYAVVGAGAVIYSPAKYGILPLLTRTGPELLQANSHIETYTILAILTGSVAGGYLADLSISAALMTALALYGLSVMVNLWIPRNPPNPAITYRHAVAEFIRDTRALLQNPRSAYSLIGTGSFWLSSAVLRMMVFAWLPLILGITSGMAISMIIAVTGVGIALGAMITPYIIPVDKIKRTLWFGLAMAFSILAFTLIHTLPLTILFLLLIGCFGGIYIVPMNTCLQQVGHSSIGAGKTIAVQNFVENLCMFSGVALYTLAAKSGVDINVSVAVAGLAMLGFVGILGLLGRKI